jgi:hypothetical protein
MGTNVRTRPKLRQHCLKRMATTAGTDARSVSPGHQACRGLTVSWSSILAVFERDRLKPVYCPPRLGSTKGANVAEGDRDWTKPAAMAIPKEGYFELERGRYGPLFPRTPACHGFSIIAKVKEGREEAVRAYGKTVEETIAASPEALAPLRLHYLRWVLFDVGSGLHFQYQGIFDTDFDKYTEDAVQLFSATGITTVFTNLEGFPEDWKENPEAFIKFVREHQVPSFLEYGEYPYVTADEIKKALWLKAAFSNMLDQMQ